jgi:phytoene dehydrogenase-like protein
VSHALCDAIRRLARFDAPLPTNAAGWLTICADAVALVPTGLRLLSPTWQEFTARFSDRFVRDALRSVFDLPDFPLLGGIMTLAWMHAHDAGYPIGGSLAFAQAIEQRYRELGGEISYGTRVTKILVEGGRAIGVRLADGTEYGADLVVSAADGHSTIYELLDGKFLNSEIRGYYERMPIFQPIVQVSLGVARDMSSEPRALTFPLAVPTEIAGQVREALNVRHMAFDATLAPAGKATLIVVLETDFDRWQALSTDRGAYQAEKRKTIEKVVAALDARFPGLAQQVEVADIATPMTWLWSTGNWRGAFEGWLPGRASMAMTFGRGMRTTLPGLSNFHMVGQWVSPGGGLPAVAPAGRRLVQRLCRADHKPFVATEATQPPPRLLPVWPARPSVGEAVAA